jgi:hypothetical protein
MLVRILEGSLPHDNGLIKANGKPIISDAQIDPDERKAAQKRFGIEKFVALHKDCIQTERSTLTGKFKILFNEAKAAIGGNKVSVKQQEAVHSYIKAVVEQLTLHSDKERNVALQNELLTVLTRMTDNDSTRRGSMQSAYMEVNKILSP